MYNSFLGFEAGKNTRGGSENIFIGYQAGYNNIGTETFPGNYNVFLGYLAVSYNKTGQDNVFLGKQAGWLNDSGGGNIYIGMNAGATLTNASSNVFVGSQAGAGKTSGGSNIFIGDQAGYGTTGGSNNIFIGFRAGKDQTESNLLFIENSESSEPLIGGNFTSDKIAINGKADPAGATLQVNGSLKVGYNGSNINRIVKATGGVTLPTLATGISSTQTITIANISPMASVILSPSDALPAGLVIAYARVSADNIVEVMFTNSSGSPIVGNSYILYITVIQ